MASESLIIELDAKTKKLEDALKSTDDKLNKIEGSTAKADKGFENFGATALKFGGIALKAGTAILAVKASLDAMVLASAKGRMELEQLSRQAKLSTGEFQALAFAAKQYGVTGEQVADISKDIADRLGEFATAGTGTFQDFLDVMGMTKEQGVVLAKEFQNLSSDQVIGEMVRRMEDAGATGNQMTFVLESMGNDLSKLSPLFADNASELKSLTGAYKDANSQLAITEVQAEELKKVSTSFDLMTAGIGNATTAISATLAPQLNSFFGSVIEVVPQATQVFIDFMNTFIDAGNITSMDQINKQMKLAEDTIARTQWAQDSLNESEILSMQQNELRMSQLVEREEAEKRLLELQAQKIELEKEQQKLDDAKQYAGGEIGATGGSGVIKTADDTEKELKAIEERFKSEETLLKEKLERELIIVGENEELKIQLFMEYDERLTELRKTKAEIRQEEFDAEVLQLQEKLAQDLISEENYLKQVTKLGEKYGKVKVKDKTENNKKEKISEWDLANGAVAAASMAFGKNKAFASTMAFINTAEGVTKAISRQDWAAAALTATTGAIQIANINASEPGSSGGDVSAPNAPTPTENTNRFSSSVEISESITDGANTTNSKNTVTITADDSDELAVAFANVLNKKITSGEITLG